MSTASGCLETLNNSGAANCSVPRNLSIEIVWRRFLLRLPRPKQLSAEAPGPGGYNEQGKGRGENYEVPCWWSDGSEEERFHHNHCYSRHVHNVRHYRRGCAGKAKGEPKVRYFCLKGQQLHSMGPQGSGVKDAHTNGQGQGNCCAPIGWHAPHCLLRRTCPLRFPSAARSPASSPCE
jgi:hypothetical protein